MLLYLDLCCFNRPWDDQTNDRVRLETEAKLLLQEGIRAGRAQLAWSYVLDYENSLNPFPDRQSGVFRWRGLAQMNMRETPSILAEAGELVGQGVGSFDALHAACARAANADMLVTTDDRLLRRLKRYQWTGPSVVLPAEALARMEGWYED